MAKKKTFETFGEVNSGAIESLTRKAPNVWNGQVNIKRYKITIEEIEEPKELLRERLIALLNQKTHISHPSSIRAEARKLGIEL